MTNSTQSPDLEQVKALFAAWQATRRNGRERIPENLWAEAIALLAKYPISVVCRELQLKPDYLRKRAQATGVKLPPKRKSKSKQEFLSLTAGQLQSKAGTASGGGTLSTQIAEQGCRIVLERTDGSRLCLSLPLEWARIETLCINFLQP